jgi:circadian clock protein KaiC
MAKQKAQRSNEGLTGIKKCPTGIRGLDEITNGGLPKGRPTLICGGAGCGKTLLAMEFIVRGIRDFGEPGAFMAFEENEDELTQNVASLGFDLKEMIRKKKLAVDFVYIERSEIEETGEYDLEGLFVRLNSMIEQTGAKRVVLDSIEALFSGLANEAIIRAELRRLFRWLKNKGVTVIITGEKGNSSLTRYGIEEYVSDCVIVLENRIQNQIATRMLRVIKYRGSSHGTNEYPTMIDEHGLSVLPISSLSLDYKVSTERISTGIDRLDEMLGGEGYYRGSSVLVSSTAGVGKTSLAASFADKVCRNGGRTLYIAYEESADQIMRNMASIGMNLGQWEKKGLLRFHSVRSSLYGLEQHLVSIHKLVREFKPAAVIVDPVSNLVAIGEMSEIKAMLTRMIDFLKNEGVTTLFTSLNGGGDITESTEVGISSMMDTWILLRNMETSGERNRLLFILKSRGMAHSNQVREFILSNEGIRISDVYIGMGSVLMGSARLVQEAKDKAESFTQKQNSLRRQRELEQERQLIRSQMESLKLKRDALEEEIKTLAANEESRLESSDRDLAGLAISRKVN